MTSLANNRSQEFSKDNEIMGVYSKYKSNGTVKFCTVKKLCEISIHQELCDAPCLWLYDVDLAVTIVLHL